MAVIEVMTAATTKYAAGEISVAEFAQQLTTDLTDEVEFWSNYSPSYEPLRPLFARCRGFEESSLGTATKIGMKSSSTDQAFRTISRSRVT